MKKIKFIFYISMLIIVSCSIYDEDFIIDNNNEFLLIDYIFNDNDYLEYNLIIKTQKNNLVYEKINNSFISELTVHIKVLDKNNEIIFSDAWDEKSIVSYYEDTKSLDDFSISRVIRIPKDKYRIYISIDDYKNHKHWNLSKTIENPIIEPLSDLVLFSKNKQDYQHIENNSYLSNVDTIWIKYQINKEKQDTSNLYIDIYPINKTYFNIDTLSNISFSVPHSLIISNKINMLPIDISNINFESIQINFLYSNILKSKNIKLRMRSSQNYDYASIIGPMEYILNKDEYFTYDTLDSLYKIKFIKDYWDTKYNNDLLDQFVNRVEYSNNNFSLFLEGGWKSDRGKIYIIYGEPMNITFDFNQNGEFEIWNYKNSLQFIFINKYGIFELYNQYGY